MPVDAGATSAIRDYLLGNLTEAEAEEVEKWYFADGHGVDEVWAEFGAMAEESLSGALSESESRRFEQRRRSSPGLREMFENEKALFDYAAKTAAEPSRQVGTGDSNVGAVRKRRWPRPVFFKPTQFVVAGAIALIVIGAWFALRAREAAKHVSPEGPQRGANDRPAEEKNSSKAAAPDQRKSGFGIGPGKISPGITATFLLSSARVRDEQSPPVLEIPAQANTVQLELELSNGDCASLSAVLHTESDETLQRWNKLRTRRDHSTPRAVLRIRADSLKSGGYVVKLDCVSPHKNPVPAEHYRFKVEKIR